MDDPCVFSIPAADQFRDAMIRKGITPPDLIEGDGKIHRFSSNGKPDDNAGWYVLYDGTIATGAFGDFRTGRAVKSWVADSGRALTAEEKRSLQIQQAQMRATREAGKDQRHTLAKAKAAALLRQSTPAPEDHPYLVCKNIKSYGLRVWNGLLVLPLYDDNGKVQSLQLISGNGNKRFLSGGKMQGCYFPLDELRESTPILIAEGYATAATIHEAMGLPVIVAYNAGNLLPVAQSIRAQYPDTPIVLCADDDINTQGNPGVTRATEAAQSVGGRVVVPIFGNNRPEGATDFNDMAAHLGKEAVSRCLMAALRKGMPTHRYSPEPHA